MTEAYPLHWPAGWPRTAHREASRFEPRELDRLGATGMVLSTNVPLRR